jgi:hypothetical protein
MGNCLRFPMETVGTFLFGEVCAIALVGAFLVKLCLLAA